VAGGTGVFTRFVRLPAAPEPPAVAGDCYEVRLDDPADPGQGRRVSVGNISVQGGVQDFAMPYNDVAQGYAVDLDNVFDIWAPGGSLSISARGTDDFGGFATMVAGPADIVGVSPSTAEEGALGRGGSTVSWTAGGGDAIEIRVRAGGVNSVIECVTLDDGEMLIPAAAFGWLPAQVAMATLEIRRVNMVEVETAAPVGTVTVALERIYSDRLPVVP
ncbi:MAG: hypothetical protein H6703_11720, partial [Myxococcales bacterium]|nr:hypothetical protein [Myxococcales bacterium]